MKILVVVVVLALCVGVVVLGFSGAFSGPDKLMPGESILVETGALYCEGAEMDWAYGNQRKEFTVGKNCYMKIKIKAVSDHWGVPRQKTIKCQMKLPMVKSVDSYYFDGIKQPITPEIDEINKVTIYNFEIGSHKENRAKEYEIVVQYVPNEAGKATMTLEYDDFVDPSYDYQSTIMFVQGE